MLAEEIRTFESLQIQYANEAFDRGEIDHNEYAARVQQHQWNIDATLED